MSISLPGLGKEGKDRVQGRAEDRGTHWVEAGAEERSCFLFALGGGREDGLRKDAPRGGGMEYVLYVCAAE